MKAIHLIQKDAKLAPSPVEKGSNIYESGYWSLTPGRAKEAIGAEIYFHESQASPSFFGGIIKDCRIKDDEPWKDRIIFKLEANREFKNVETDRSGWAMEMKMVE